MHHRWNIDFFFDLPSFDMWFDTICKRATIFEHKLYSKTQWQIWINLFQFRPILCFLKCSKLKFSHDSHKSRMLDNGLYEVVFVSVVHFSGLLLDSGLSSLKLTIVNARCSLFQVPFFVGAESLQMYSATSKISPHMIPYQQIWTWGRKTKRSPTIVEQEKNILWMESSQVQSSSVQCVLSRDKQELSAPTKKK